MANQKIDLSAGMIPKRPTHPLGDVTGYSHSDGLPIVKIKQSSSQPAQSPAKAAEPAETPKPKQATQPTLTKGAKVSLPDGSTGQVAHVIDGKSARVRTEAGKNVVMKQSDLTPAGHVLVKEHLRKLPQ